MPVRIKLFYRGLDGKLVNLPLDYNNGVEFPDINDPDDMTSDMLIDVVERHMDEYENILTGISFSIHWAKSPLPLDTWPFSIMI